MEVIRSGFDKLELALNVVVPAELCEHLASAKEYAMDLARKNRFAQSGTQFNGLDLIMRPTGSGGGYAYSFETVQPEANWFLKESSVRCGWGARVAVRALPLVLYGFGWVKAELEKTINALGLKVPPNGVSISRVDYAVDCLAPGFEINTENFVVHSSTNVNKHLEAEDMSVAGKSWRESSVRLGGVTRKQIAVYDKLREVRQKQKSEMYEIWDAARASQGLRPLVYSGVEADAIWRVELRAGKEYLKDRWGVTGWGGLIEHLPALLAEIMRTIRYAEPTSDSNRARWPNHPLWDLVSEEVAQNVMRHVPSIGRDRVVEVALRDKIEWFETNLLGNAISHAALLEVSVEDLPDHLVGLGKKLSQLNDEHTVPAENRLSEARRRYERFLQRSGARQE
jgi:hypothetical protein